MKRNVIYTMLFYTFNFEKPIRNEFYKPIRNEFYTFNFEKPKLISIQKRYVTNPTRHFAIPYTLPQRSIYTNI